MEKKIDLVQNGDDISPFDGTHFTLLWIQSILFENLTFRLDPDSNFTSFDADTSLMCSVICGSEFSFDADPFLNSGFFFQFNFFHLHSVVISFYAQL